MAHAEPLPREFAAVPFSTRSARARGVSPGRLAARDLVHPFHGVNAHPGTGDIRERCTAYASRMLEGQVFSHRTAALLYELPVQANFEWEPVHVSVPFPRTPPRARGVHGHSLREMSVGAIHGFPVCAPAQVWVQLAATTSAEELVAIGDHIVGGNRRAALATVDQLATAAKNARSVRGAGALRWALGHIRWGADSRPESLLRLALIDEGLREPLVNPPVALPGGLLVHPDLVFGAEGVILEYEGHGHRVDAAQWQRDIRRYESMVSAGWRVIRVTSRDLFVDRPQLMSRVRTAVGSCDKRG